MSRAVVLFVTNADIVSAVRGGEVMDFNFLLDINVLTFIMIFVVFGAWEIAKIITKKDFDPKLITTINGAVAVIYAVLVAGFLGAGFFDSIITAGAVFSAGSFFDLLKAYGAIKQ